MSTPDPETRLKTVVNALREVVIPALPPSEVLASEQAGLCVAQLAMLAEQLRHVSAYEATGLAAMVELGGTLAEHATGGPATAAATTALRRRLDAAEASGTAEPATDARERRRDVGLAVDDLIRAVSRDGDPAARTAVRRDVVRHGAEQALRDRTWFAATGMDPDPSSLGTVPGLITGESR